jgi:hypothetical protein
VCLRASAEVVNLLKLFGGTVDISRCSSITIKKIKNVLRYSCFCLVLVVVLVVLSWAASSSSFFPYLSAIPVWVANFALFSLILAVRGGGRRKSLLFSLLSWLSACSWRVLVCADAKCCDVLVLTCRLRSYCCSLILYVVHSYSYVATLLPVVGGGSGCRLGITCVACSLLASCCILVWNIRMRTNSSSLSYSCCFAPH